MQSIWLALAVFLLVAIAYASMGEGVYITYEEENEQPFNIFEEMTQEIICLHVAFLEVTRSLNHEKVYTKKEKVRYWVRRRMDDTYPYYRRLWNELLLEYLEYLESGGLLCRNGDIRCYDYTPEDSLKIVADEFISFLNEFEANILFASIERYKQREYEEG